MYLHFRSSISAFGGCNQSRYGDREPKKYPTHYQYTPNPSTHHGTSFPPSPPPPPPLSEPSQTHSQPNPSQPKNNNQKQADKLRTQQQLEQLQARYIGTGHADTTKHEWSANIHRDSYASYIGHPPLLSWMAVGMGECRERVRAGLVEVRLVAFFIFIFWTFGGRGRGWEGGGLGHRKNRVQTMLTLLSSPPTENDPARR